MPRLLVNYGTPHAWVIPLHPGVNTLGREVVNDFPIDHESVSSAHCQIIVTGDTATIRDLGSASGTLVDNQPTSEAEIRSGQLIRLGQVEMLFDADTPVDLAEPPVLPAPELAVDPPVPPPVPGTSGAANLKVGKCHNHRKIIAHLFCNRCRQYFCDTCVSVRPGARDAGRCFCLRCGQECQRLQPSLEELLPSVEEFLPSVPKSFAYPFQGDGWILMLLGTIGYSLFTAFRRLPGFGLFALVGSLTIFLFVSGYTLTYLLKIITSTAHGENEMPDWPDFGGWDDIKDALWQGFGTIVICFSPGIITSLFLGEMGWLVIAPAILLGCFYFPMAFLAVAMFDTLSAINPMLVVPSILRVFSSYLVACGVLVVVFLLQSVLQVLVQQLHIPIVTGLVAGFISFYFTIVEMRLLGMLYRTRRDDLGWDQVVGR